MDQNPRKRAKQHGDKQSDAEFKTLVIRMFKELSEDLSSMKMIQSELMKPRIKSMIWNKKIKIV